MKILFALPYMPSPIRVRPYQFIRQLSTRHEISLLAIDSRQSFTDAEALRPFCQRVELVPFRRTQAVHRCMAGVARGLPLQAVVSQSAELDHRLRLLTTHDAFDMVHVEHLRAARLGALLPVELPRVIDAVDSISLLWERTMRSSHSLVRRLIARFELPRTRAFEARMTRWYDGVALTSEIERQAFKSLAPDARIATIPNGVDLDYFHPIEEQTEPATMILSGKMSYHANATAAVHFVKNILPLIRAKRSDARVRIVGVGPSSAVRALAKEPGVEVVASVPSFSHAIASAAIAVSPVTVKVGIQNKILEAMACGVPVVATEMGAEGIGAERGRDFLVAKNPLEFAAYVEQLLANQELRKQIGLAGRRFVECHHRWSEATNQLVSFYQEAIDSHRERRN